MIKSPQVNDLGDLPSRVGEGAMPHWQGSQWAFLQTDGL